MRDQDGTVSRAAIDAANRRIQAAIDALPDYASPEFWPALAAQGAALPTEVLVHVVRVLCVHGPAVDVERAVDELIARAHPIAAAVVRRALRSRPQEREDARCDALAAMWCHIVAGTPFWERNFVGALNAICISVCRMYLARKRTATAFADLSTAEEGTAYDERLPDWATEAEQEQLLGRLTYERALASLEPGLREIARLMAEGELTQRQIAAQVGCTEKTVYNRLARIRDHLAGFFYEEVRYMMTTDMGPAQEFEPIALAFLEEREHYTGDTLARFVTRYPRYARELALLAFETAAAEGQERQVVPLPAHRRERLRADARAALLPRTDQALTGLLARGREYAGLTPRALARKLDVGVDQTSVSFKSPHESAQGLFQRIKKAIKAELHPGVIGTTIHGESNRLHKGLSYSAGAKRAYEQGAIWKYPGGGVTIYKPALV